LSWFFSEEFDEERRAKRGVVAFGRGWPMTRKKLIEEIKLNPARYYRAPSDVNRDRRFSNEERLQILAAWERDVRSLSLEDDSSELELQRLRQVTEARTELQNRMPSASSSAEQKSGPAGHQ
jgi:hypothetical protein